MLTSSTTQMHTLHTTKCTETQMTYFFIVFVVSFLDTQLNFSYTRRDMETHLDRLLVNIQS